MILAAAAAAGWPAALDAWHEFYLMAGTAAVTLAGLLFVAISLHIDALLHASREHLLALARNILLSFTLVLTLSLMMLVPHATVRMTSLELLAIGVVGAAVTMRQLRARIADHADFSRALFRRRLMLPLAGYLWIAATGVALLTLRAPELLFMLIGAICMLLGNAAGASWDLLVRTARIRHRSDMAARETAPAHAASGDRPTNMADVG